MNRNITEWVRACLHCQRNKIHRHNKLRPEQFPVKYKIRPHAHRQRGLTICDTRIPLLCSDDRFTRWPEATSVQDVSAEQLAKAVVNTWLLVSVLPKLLLQIKVHNSNPNYLNPYVIFLVVTVFELQHII